METGLLISSLVLNCSASKNTEKFSTLLQEELPPLVIQNPYERNGGEWIEFELDGKPGELIFSWHWLSSAPVVASTDEKGLTNFETEKVKLQ